MYPEGVFFSMINNQFQIEVESCIICGSKDKKIKHHFPANRYDHSKFITHSWDGGKDVELTIVACNSCGFLYQSPIFKDEYISCLYPTSIIPEKLDDSNMDFARADYFVNLVKPYLKKINNPFALDIGTRYGALPMSMRKAGIESVGIDFNPACVKASQKFGFEHIYNYKITETPKLLKHYNREKFNLITMVDVIEHLTHAEQDFELISSLQGKGDVFMATTMFTDSLGYWLFGKEWYYIHAQHTLYFSRANIKRFLLKYGYEVKQVVNIPRYKSITIVAEETLKYFKHKAELRNKKPVEKKTWFATNRPHCFDLMTVIAVKK
jgi:2-polyprenyl-3-methyl-5-hydroxy-6-metoxy-1,4-benzoquinol methylase